MSDVADLNKWRMQKNGEQMFLGCPCGGQEFAVVCLSNQEIPVIATLICTECGEGVDVAFGEVK